MWFAACTLPVTVAVYTVPAAESADSGPGSLTAAVLEARADIKTASDALNRWRDEVAGQRRPLARQLTALQAEVKRLRAEAERRRQARAQGELEREALASRVARQTEECRFIRTLVSEYRRSLETRAGRAESEWLAAQLDPIDQGLAESDDFAGLPSAVEQLLNLADAWNGSRLGGRRFHGRALDASGIQHRGNFAVFGPVAYFAASDGSVAGPAVTRVGSTAPSLFTGFDDETIGERLAALVEGEEADVPVDVTRGDAMRAAAAREGLLTHLRKGGFVIVPLLVVAAVAVVLIVVKSVSLIRIRLDYGSEIDSILEAMNAARPDDARQTTVRLGEPLGPILEQGIEHADLRAEHLEEILSERVASAVPGLERHLQTLAVLGAIAPLLGLLGTVTGMIHTFQLVTVFGSGDAKLLSGGISEALVTTEVGLIIAVPVLLVHAFLARRVRIIVGVLERTVAEFVHQLKVHAEPPTDGGA
jgi:biopolymer transport protein ExbB